MDNFQASGEEIERALMDLEPFGLAVSIKEEAPDETLGGSAAHPAPPANVGSAAENGVGESAGAGAGGSAVGEAGSGADSLASPGAPRAAPHAARCVLCHAALQQAPGTPKLMECLHSICEPCLKAKVEEKQSSSRDFLGAETVTIQCPACRLQCQPANMIDQRFVLEKMAVDQAGPGSGSVNGEQQCNSCEETEPATSYCVDCAEFICDNCVHAHQRLKITKDHTIKGKEEAIAELHAAQGSRAPNDMYCRDHPQERLSLFCETCDRLTCRDCQLQHHRDHRYQFSTEMAAQARGNIAALLSEVNYKRVLLGSAMKVIRDRQQLIADKKKALVHEITQTVVKLTNAINTRGKQLVLRLNEVCDAKQRTLSEKKEALEQLASITDHCVEFVSSALEHAGDTALLYCKPTVTSHLQRIKSRRADIPNPEIPVRITLSLDKLPDLIRVLSSIGAIVVDGKVDGGGAGGSAQGPYHPPAPAAPPAPPAPPPASPHSAVVALQHAAIHQSYVQSGGSVGNMGSGGPGAMSFLPLGGPGGGAGGSGGPGGRSRAHTPLRHALVSSTTHPHHLHGMTEMNLRGLLNAQAQQQQQQQQRAPRPHHAAQQAMHAYHQLYAFAANAANAGGRRSGTPRTPSPAPPAYHHHQQQQQQHQPHQQHQQLQQLQQHQAKWHIPQHGLTNGGFEVNMMSPTGAGGSDFKITLGRSHVPAPPGVGTPRAAHPPSVVTSTNPKTPSPSLNGGVSLELDKVCAESVQDLMATIAKLDSNGVQVLPEPEPEPGPASVHSSTDDTRGKLGVTATGAATATATATAGAGAGGAASGDPNEDWCAVCMDGGELMCCDKCPKVFHQYCHIPTIEKLPDETESWQCLLCVNFLELPPATEEGGAGLPPRLQKLVERVTLELYCQYELSLAFREPVPLDNVHYHATIARPMCLDMIRLKLQPRAGPGVRYSHPAQFVTDCRLLFRNAYRFNPPDSQIYKDAKRLEEFFDAQLVKWLPEFAFWSGEGDPPAKRTRLD